MTKNRKIKPSNDPSKKRDILPSRPNNQEVQQNSYNGPIAKKSKRDKKP